MPMPRKRPLQDPNQPYTYIWRLNGEVLWVGCGKNNRCRPGCKASWSGRPVKLIQLLETHRHEVQVEVIPFGTKQEAINKERELIVSLKPKFNTAPQHGGWKGMHTEKGLNNIRTAVRDRPVTQAQRAARRASMVKLNSKRYGHAH